MISSDDRPCRTLQHRDISCWDWIGFNGRARRRRLQPHAEVADLCQGRVSRHHSGQNSELRMSASRLYGVCLSM